MSRSYREPWITQGYGGQCRKWQKRYANRSVRKTADVPNGKAYRKYWDPWNICDWKWKWDPWVDYWWINGKMEAREPDPLYRVRSK
jgi:hypothetical protein